MAFSLYSSLGLFRGPVIRKVVYIVRLRFPAPVSQPAGTLLVIGSDCVSPSMEAGAWYREKGMMEKYF